VKKVFAIVYRLVVVGTAGNVQLTGIGTQPLFAREET